MASNFYAAEYDMRVLLINHEFPPDGGGGGWSTLQLASALGRLGHKVSVLTSIGTDKCSDVGNNTMVYKVGPQRRFRYRFSIFGMVTFLLAALLWILRKGGSRYDVAVSFFSFPAGVIGFALKKRWGVPYIVSLRGADVPGNEKKLNLLHWLITPLRRVVLNRAFAIVACSQALARSATTVDNVSVEVIPNAVDGDFFQPSTRIHRSVGDALNLLFVGRLQWQKDVPGLIQHLGEVRKAGISFRLTVVGDGPELADSKREAASSDLTDVITWVGWLDRKCLIKTYQEADYMINYSRYEGMPNTVLEAMACGVPAIASNIDAHRELIEDQVTGFLVSRDSWHELFQVLERLQNGTDVKGEIGVAAREYVVNHHALDRIVRSYDDLCQRSSSS